SLGIVSLCRMAPVLLFTLIGGVVADRMERRRLMFATQTVAMVLAFVLAVLVSTNLVEFWMVLLIAIGRGVAMSFNMPARQSLISELVPPEDLMNAIALNSATQNLTHVIGPAIGGFLIAVTGVSGAFYLNGASFLAVLYALSIMRFAERPVKVHSGVFADLTDGVSYLSRHTVLRTLVLLALLPMALGMPYMTMLTIFASDVLKVGGGGLGLLTACAGIGAVVGALLIASARDIASRGRLMLVGLVAFGLMLAAFSFSPWLWLSLIMLLGVGASQQAYQSVNNTLIQSYVDEKYRGRVLSTLLLSRSMVPLGTMLAGVGTVAFGASVTMGAMGLALVVIGLLVARLVPAARKLR
ncbi:MAG: MFS transporter, partial [Dehalococcoidia bacterium]|nr:MFS transporter [Dehalococcoidia bacterium]